MASASGRYQPTRMLSGCGSRRCPYHLECVLELPIEHTARPLVDRVANCGIEIHQECESLGLNAGHLARRHLVAFIAEVHALLSISRIVSERELNT